MFQADGGVALVIQNRGMFMQIGVASFVSSRFPSGFARVTSFRAWIRLNTGL